MYYSKIEIGNMYSQDRRKCGVSQIREQILWSENRASGGDMNPKLGGSGTRVSQSYGPVHINAGRIGIDFCPNKNYCKRWSKMCKVKPKTRVSVGFQVQTCEVSTGMRKWKAQF